MYTCLSLCISLSKCWGFTQELLSMWVKLAIWQVENSAGRTFTHSYCSAFLAKWGFSSLSPDFTLRSLGWCIKPQTRLKCLHQPVLIPGRNPPSPSLSCYGAVLLKPLWSNRYGSWGKEELLSDLLLNLHQVHQQLCRPYVPLALSLRGFSESSLSFACKSSLCYCKF